MCTGTNLQICRCLRDWNREGNRFIILLGAEIDCSCKCPLKFFKMTIVKNAEMECFNPEITREIEISSNKYIVNDRYYLMDFSAWDDQIRDWLANKEGIVIGNEHLHVINHLRYLYSQNKRHPASRAVTSDLSMKFGAEKGTTRYFHTLFPKGIHQAYLIAGIPMQDSCC